MPFLSIEAVVYFILFFPIYWALKKQPAYQNNFLLFSGLIVLAYINIWFALVLVVFSLLITALSIQISKSKERMRKFWFAVSLCAVGGNLAVFKYFDFFRPMLQSIFSKSDLIDVLLPLGLSYYSFQSITYLVSVYKQENIKLEWNELLLYFSFFPTITAGPIARVNSFQTILGKQEGVASQIKTKEQRQVIRPVLALSLILLGVTKKWWFSSWIANEIVDPVFENPMQYDAFTVLSSIYGYTAQLYFDFSGYSEMVIGLAMLLGFSLPFNFYMPLASHNIREFWNRWHISLSTWIRDYIYIPLGGSRHGFFRTQLNLLIAMILSGIWHGYGWNFFVWGALHGSALVLLNCGDRIFGGKNKFSQNWLTKTFSMLITLTFVSGAFVVFRVESINDALLIFESLFSNEAKEVYPTLYTVMFLMLFISFVLLNGILYQMLFKFINIMERANIIFLAFVFIFIMLVVIIFSPSGIPGFIYANF